MDETKLLQMRRRRRFASLPDTRSLQEMSSPLDKVKHDSSDAELHRNRFSTGTKHSIHSWYSSSRRDITGGFKFLPKHSSNFHVKLQGEDFTPEETNSNVATRLAYFPALKKSMVASDISPVRKTTCLKRMHAWNDYEGREIRGSSNVERPWVEGEKMIASFPDQGTKPSFTQIRRPVSVDYRRLSLPIPSERTTELYSTSFLSSEKLRKRRDLETEAAHLYPSLVYSGSMGRADELVLPEPGSRAAELSLRSMGTFDCTRANQTSLPVKATSKGNVEENDNASALRTHVETADTDFNKVETKAVRLLEWLSDQSDIKL